MVSGLSVVDVQCHLAETELAADPDRQAAARSSLSNLSRAWRTWIASGDTTRPLSVMLTQRRTRLPGGHHLQTRSSPIRTCTGPTRLHRDERPRSSRPRTSTLARHPEPSTSPGYQIDSRAICRPVPSHPWMRHRNSTRIICVLGVPGHPRCSELRTTPVAATVTNTSKEGI